MIQSLYPQAYVTFSNYTYNIAPNLNRIQAWMAVAKKAPVAYLALTVDFYRG